jgi:hypothetical protein
MNWYAAKIVFQIVSDNNPDTAQFDEQVRLIQAVSRELALEIAHQFGLMAQEDFPTKKGSLLEWKFVAVIEIEFIGELEHGAEIHYAIKEPSEKELYLQRVQEKALNLKRVVQQQLLVS